MIPLEYIDPKMRSTFVTLYLSESTQINNKVVKMNLFIKKYKLKHSHANK